MKILSQKIQIIFLSITLLLLLVFTSNTKSSSASAHILTQSNLDYIKTSCNVTLYKRLCYLSLSPHASSINSDPLKISLTALNLSLSSAKSLSIFINNLSHTLTPPVPPVAAAVADCVEEIGDSVSELRDSVREMDTIYNYKDSSRFEMVMSDVETWVSAALTDDDTCMDGFKEIGQGKAVMEIKDLVRRHVVKVGRMTSNALALINMYASTQQN